MAGYNRAILIGRVGKDPESKTFANGGKIVVFSVATSETWKDKATGERKERTEWHNIKIENENAASVAESYVRKGSEVGIEGSIQTRKWQDKDGNDRYTTEIVVGRFDGKLTLIGGRQAGEANAGGNSAGHRPASGSTAPPRDNDLDDDVPF